MKGLNIQTGAKEKVCDDPQLPTERESLTHPRHKTRCHNSPRHKTRRCNSPRLDVRWSPTSDWAGIPNTSTCHGTRKKVCDPQLPTERESQTHPRHKTRRHYLLSQLFFVYPDTWLHEQHLAASLLRPYHRVDTDGTHKTASNLVNATLPPMWHRWHTWDTKRPRCCNPITDSTRMAHTMTHNISRRVSCMCHSSWIGDRVAPTITKGNSCVPLMLNRL